MDAQNPLANGRSSCTQPTVRLADIAFDGTPINGALIESLGSDACLDQKRNVVLVGGTGTGTGKSRIAIGIARNIIRAGR